jgi:hypothetical protein
MARPRASPGVIDGRTAFDKGAEITPHPVGGNRPEPDEAQNVPVALSSANAPEPTLVFLKRL